MAPFYKYVREAFGPLKQTQVNGFNVLLKATEGLPTSHRAYILATAWHETAATMQPIKEYGGHQYLDKYDTGRLAERLGNTPQDDDDGQLYAGRGYVQITGRANYRRFGIELTPDDALKPEVAADIIVRGMTQGLFTGRKLYDYLFRDVESLGSFTSSRKIVNGLDKSTQIAQHALKFQAALLTLKDNTHG